jgi:four helix bundle protein
MAKGDDIEARLINFAVTIIDVTDMLPNTRAGNHMAGQLVRSGTNPAAHYAEARGAESQKDFIHKLRLCYKELNESRVWLNIIGVGRLIPREQVIPVYRECDELCRITKASVETARARLEG